MNFIETKETGKISAAQIIHDSASIAAISRYKKFNKQQFTPRCCAYCGEKDHGSTYKAYIYTQKAL